MTTQDGYDWPTPHSVVPELPREPKGWPREGYQLEQYMANPPLDWLECARRAHKEALDSLNLNY